MPSVGGAVEFGQVELFLHVHHLHIPAAVLVDLQQPNGRHDAGQIQKHTRTEPATIVTIDLRAMHQIISDGYQMITSLAILILRGAFENNRNIKFFESSNMKRVDE